MFTKSRKPKDIHLYTCEEMSAYALTLRKEKITHLDLWNSPFPSMSVEQMAALGKMVRDSKVTHLILRKNDFGLLSLPCLEAFATSLSGAEELVEFAIDVNQLHVSDFSSQHWQVLRSLFASLPLKKISLQYNDLDDLEEEQFSQLKQIIQEANHPCLIATNNWSSKRWIEVINMVDWQKQKSASSLTL
ncbi:hypothetical protein J2N86_08660 [Legionella lytica]|uniref:Leucine Rich repeats (2 copies) n=1 Tax=Legionella lytica TaxID=96232 RepID=A0ABY4Y575_9GAMM|nr:hypothetical protein [Legionella lytica]USQ12778.1 hypothetical protein J2N86_08660 [Legionella lytica]